MADLTRREKARLEHALNMGGGYVLDFSNRTFGEFFQNVAGIDIYADEYTLDTGSKANRMRAIWAIGSNANVAKVLRELVEEMRFPGREELNTDQVDALVGVANRLDPSADTHPGVLEVSNSAIASPRSAFISYKWESDAHRS